MTDLAEYIIFALVRYNGGEVLADNAVPVGRVLGVKECLHVLGDILLGLLGGVVHDQVDLLLEVLFHVLGHFADHVVDDSIGAHACVCVSSFLFN